MRKMVEYQCLTCAFPVEIDLMDDTGKSDEAAHRKHTRHDGAHQGNWCRQVGDDILSPMEERERLGLVHDYLCDVMDGRECDCSRVDAVARLSGAPGTWEVWEYSNAPEYRPRQGVVAIHAAADETDGKVILARMQEHARDNIPGRFYQLRWVRRADKSE